MTAEWTDDLMAGVMELAVAESRIREIAHLAERATTEVGHGKNLLSYGYADKAELNEIQLAVQDIMLLADKLASRIAAVRMEAVQ